MAKPLNHLSEELATSLVAEASFTPGDRIPALLKRYGVCRRTLDNWIERVAASPVLADTCEKKKQQLRQEWQPDAIQCLREIIDALRDQASKARQLESFNPDAMHKLAGAGKIIGELLTVENVLDPGGKQPSAHRQSSTPAKASGVGARAAGGAGAPAGQSPAAPAAETRDPVH